jgi:Flp pilus assembly protein TadD
MENLEQIKQFLAEGATDEAIALLIGFTEKNPDSDEAYFLLGNAYRKKENWEFALNNYRKAMDLNHESPAKHAYKMVIDILNFYNKDMFNQ